MCGLIVTDEQKFKYVMNAETVWPTSVMFYLLFSIALCLLTFGLIC